MKINPKNKRRGEAAFIGIALLAAVLIAWLGARAYAWQPKAELPTHIVPMAVHGGDTYQCMSVNGCVAWYMHKGRKHEVQFRKGEVMTDGGGLHPDFDRGDDDNGGWVRLKPHGGGE